MPPVALLLLDLLSRASYKPAAMSFRTHLESVVNQVDGALACSVMGFDGISVDTHQKEDAAELELNGAWVEYANLLGQLRQAAETLKTGEVQEVSVNSERVLTLMRLITPEYFLVLALRADGNYGKGRYVLRVIAPKIRAEL
jgi:predicted regulator of Ras-like GTPase activity (Roadblock/LC7/MglB family)